MQITKASEVNRDDIKNLLQSQKLPGEDLPSSLNHFYTAVDEDKIIGLIGMELYGRYGLLRSMVVHPEYRNQRIAETLITMLEQQAIDYNITTLYLLTETADKYFSRKGYTIIDRDEVPKDLMQSSEFSHVCPVSAIVMKKDLITNQANAS